MYSQFTDMSAIACKPVESTLPSQVASALWRGTQVGRTADEVRSSGFATLDEQLPGGGWPTRAVTEILQAQPSLCEWRLLGPCLRRLAEGGHPVVAVGPPKAPHAGGLQQHGLDTDRFAWIDAETPAERLWATEQLVKSNPGGAVLAWLPQARAEQLRRLQVHASSCEALVFLFRPAAAQFEASPAPLRVLASLEGDWGLQVHLFKRKGAPGTPVSLFAIPDALAAMLTPQQVRPTRVVQIEVRDVRPMGSIASQPPRLRAVS
jgi:protein ImuA